MKRETRSAFCPRLRAASVTRRRSLDLRDFHRPALRGADDRRLEHLLSLVRVLKVRHRDHRRLAGDDVEDVSGNGRQFAVTVTRNADALAARAYALGAVSVDIAPIGLRDLFLSLIQTNEGTETPS